MGIMNVSILIVEWTQSIAGNRKHIQTNSEAYASEFLENLETSISLVKLVIGS